MRGKSWILVAIGCGTFMATLDSSIVNIALPTLTRSLGADIGRIKWIVVIYLLVISTLLLPLGRLSDLFGRRRVFQGGFLVFTLGSALCGISRNLPWLLFARVVQGIGAAMLMSNGPAILTATLPTEERGKNLGILAMVVSAGLVTGPGLGGWIITHWGWPALFWINIPIGFFGLYLAQAVIPVDAYRKSFLDVLLRFDWWGTLVQMACIVIFICLVEPPSLSFSGGSGFKVSRLFLFLIEMILVFAFLRIEKQSTSALFDLDLLKIRSYWTGNVASFLNFVAFSSMTFFFPFYLQDVLHFTPDRAGAFMSAIPLAIFVTAPLSGRWSDVIGSRSLCIFGTALVSLTLFGMSGSLRWLGITGLTEVSLPVSIVVWLALAGMATGVFQSPNNSAIMGVVPATKLGVASALLATVRNLGLMLGNCLATVLFDWRFEQSHHYMGALKAVWSVSGIMAFGALLASFGQAKKNSMNADG